MPDADRRRYTRSGKYYFDPAAARAAQAFIETHLRLTKFQFAGKPFLLARWQRRIVRKLFGWKRLDGTRRHRRCWIEVPRGNGKTEFAAALALTVWLGDADVGADFYSLASEENQARIVFERATQMVSLSDDLSRGIEPFKTSLWHGGTQSGFKPLSAAPKSKQGFRPKGFVGDEVHVWDSGELAETVHDGEGVTPQPLDIYITTAGEVGTFAHEQHEHAMSVLRGEIEDDELLIAIYGADPEDDWTDPKVWEKANPSYGITVRPEFLAGECRKARQLPRLENRFRRYFLDQWVEQSTRWLPMEYWDLCTAAPSDRARKLFLSDPEREPDIIARAAAKSGHDRDLWRRLPEMMRGRPCAGGLDLATTRDIAAYALWFAPPREGDPETILWRFYLPRETLKTLKEKDRQQYQEWADAGALTLTPGNVADYAFIKRDILADSQRYRIGAFGIDRWNATQLATDLLNTEGLPVELFGQGFASMSGPSKEFERLVLGLSIEHGNHPVARWMAKNASIDEDAHDNIKPVKPDDRSKIDGIVAAVMAKGMLMGNPVMRSIYDEEAEARATAATTENTAAQAQTKKPGRSIYDREAETKRQAKEKAAA